MLSRARWTVVGTVVAASALVTGLTMVGCGGDDIATPVDGSTDTSVDVTVDARLDVSPDVTDAGADVIVDSSTGDPDAIAAFMTKQVENTCLRLAQCCFGNDASAFDTNKCKGYTGNGVEGNLAPLVANPALVNGGRISLDKNLANACLAESLLFSCPTAQATEYSKTTNDCYASITGTQATGAFCNSSIECASGNYCKPGTGDAGSDAGTGLCVKLLTQGAGTCGSGNVECQYRGFLGPAARCDINPAADGGPAPNTCASRLVNGTGCQYSWECQSGSCDLATQKCQPTFLTVSSGLCGFFTIQDAGDGG
ncbi:hypothetical protein BH09MYX1_BH09MYX1_53790 [soil metagenome]